jgi:alanyl-tRNA synthetase
VEKYVGENIKDPYGRVIGRLIAFYSDVDGTVTAVEIAKGDLGFETVPIERIKITSEGVSILPTWKSEAISVAAQFDRAKKRAKALEDLYAKSEIPRHAYDEFKKKVDAAITRLRSKNQEVKALLRRIMGELEDEIVHIEKALTAMKMSYIAGEISEKAYKAAAEALRTNRDKDLDEKNDIKKMLEKLTKLEEEPAQLAASSQAPAKPAIPEDAPAVPIDDQAIFVEVVES